MLARAVITIKVGVNWLSLEMDNIRRVQPGRVLLDECEGLALLGMRANQDVLENVSRNGR